ncbi:MAG: hypothetical protein ACK4P3_09690, partial [Fimbriimonadaceae bacterium]
RPTPHRHPCSHAQETPRPPQILLMLELVPRIVVRHWGEHPVKKSSRQTEPLITHMPASQMPKMRGTPTETHRISPRFPIEGRKHRTGPVNPASNIDLEGVLYPKREHVIER